MRISHRFSKSKTVIIISIFLIITFLFNGCSILFRTKVGQLTTTTEVPIYYEEKGEGEPVILLHGVMVNSDLNWKLPKVYQKLAKDNRVIAVDLRGHGFSGKPRGLENYGIKLVEDIVDLMNELNIEKAHIVGYSLGGFIALKFATTYPERAYSVVIAGAGWEKSTPQNLERLKKITNALREYQDCTPLLELVGMRNEGLQRIAIWIANVYYRKTNDFQSIADLLDSVPELEVSEDSLKKCSLPVLIIAGTNDPLCDTADELATVLPNGKLIWIYNGTHMNTIFKKQFCEAIMSHLTNHK
ncbi:MAG: alpha/beta hydrolase [Candidatus Hydrogenedentes bacterium]|nr:alpha/beta hydrolase [Candidatus Hydrogenedentota bacterium]